VRRRCGGEEVYLHAGKPGVVGGREVKFGISMCGV